MLSVHSHVGCACRCGHDGIFLGINGKLNVGTSNNLKGTGVCWLSKAWYEVDRGGSCDGMVCAVMAWCERQTGVSCDGMTDIIPVRYGLVAPGC